MARLGNRYRIFVQNADNGEVVEVTGTVVNLSISQDFAMPMSTTIELSMIGGPVSRRLTDDLIAGLDAPPSKEWFCDYCKSVNPIKRTKCASCGASRSFLVR